MAYLSPLLLSVILCIDVRQVSLHALLHSFRYMLETVAVYTVVVFGNVDIFRFDCFGDFDLGWHVNRLFGDVRVRTLLRKIVPLRIVCRSIVRLIRHSRSGIGRFGLSKHFC